MLGRTLERVAGVALTLESRRATRLAAPRGLTRPPPRDNGVFRPFAAHMRSHHFPVVLGIYLAANAASLAHAQEVKPPAPPPEFDPATEPAVVAVTRVLPAVVNIATERTIRQKVQDPFEDFYEQFFNAPSNRRPREYKQTIQSLGSGFLIDADGDIVTNEHVVERAADLKIQVTFSDGTSLPARYVSGDAAADLALIKIERDAKHDGKPFPFINLNNPSPNLLGETVLVLGNPLGYNSSVARGILSANDREITVEETNYKHLLQTDAAINPGNSGGPLIDLAGRLVGISSGETGVHPAGYADTGPRLRHPRADRRGEGGGVPRRLGASADGQTRRRECVAQRAAVVRVAASGAHAGTGARPRGARRRGRVGQRRGTRQPCGAGGIPAGDDHLQDRHLHGGWRGADRGAAEGRERRHVGRFRRGVGERRRT